MIDPTNHEMLEDLLTRYVLGELTLQAADLDLELGLLSDEPCQLARLLAAQRRADVSLVGATFSGKDASYG